MLRIELTVSDLALAERFYTGALGFESVEAGVPAHAALLGAARIAQVVLRRGGQEIALQQFDPAGAPYPEDASACDQAFQHFAMPVDDMAAAVARLGVVDAISRGGPQLLPERSGGVTAFKFRDPDGHPLELIQFPDGRGGGIDHSAIVVTDAARSIAFCCDRLGLRVAARQVNIGPEQDRLDGLRGAEVEVVALQPAVATPHVELLGYRRPAVRLARPALPADILATRLVFEVADGEPALVEDPDGHKLVLIPQ